MTISVNAFGDGFKTSGNGTIYSFEKLATTENSGVSKIGTNEYLIEKSDTIHANDSFEIDKEGTVYFANAAELIIEGKASLTANENGLTLTRHTETDIPYGIEVRYDNEKTDVENITFHYVGLKSYSTSGLNVKNCTFKEHNGTASGALFLGTDGAEFTVDNCYFELCQKAAIGGAANFFCPITITNSTFRKNSQANGNIPQLNLTAATNITISGCEVEGDPNLNMVGGIGVSNFYGTEGFKVTLNNCNIYNNRYGFTSMGVMDVEIVDNIIKDNCYETNPNNGGSGISLYDPYRKQNAVISGNKIEGNLWGITVIGCADVNMGKTEVDEDSEDYNRGENIFKDNGNNGVLYDLYNNSDNTIYAQNNLWNVATQDREHIEEVIFHKNDNNSLGEVIFMPAADEKLSIGDLTMQRAENMQKYDLSGRKIESLSSGIYIQNGKKFIKK